MVRIRYIVGVFVGHELSQFLLLCYDTEVFRDTGGFDLFPGYLSTCGSLQFVQVLARIVVPMLCYIFHLARLKNSVYSRRVGR